MSRTRKAFYTSAANYAHLGLSMVFGFVLFPIALSYLGDRDYGVWLASLEILGYVALTDLGVLRVLPWLFAAADGKGDLARTRALMANGFGVGICIAVVMAALGLALWLLAPSGIPLDATERAAVAVPLAILVAVTVLTYPLKVSGAMLRGKQDVIFVGITGIAASTITFAISWRLLELGYGITALAIANALGLATASLATLGRSYLRFPEVWKGWPRPRLLEMGRLLCSGFGAWFGGLGVMLITASNGIILLKLGRPELIPVYLATAKLARTALQLCRVLPDGALVGLAQLHGEGEPGKVYRVVRSILVLNVALASLAACLFAVVNPLFVSLWVGTEYYGGDPLQVLLACEMVFSGVIHGVATSVGPLGYRLPMGVSVVVSGVLHLGIALLIVPHIGLVGLPASLMACTLVSSLPVGLILLARLTGVGVRQLLREIFVPCIARIAPALCLGILIGTHSGKLPAWIEVACAAMLCLGTAHLLSPLLEQFPWPAKLRKLLTRMRFFSPPV